MNQYYMHKLTNYQVVHLAGEANIYYYILYTLLHTCITVTNEHMFITVWVWSGRAFFTLWKLAVQIYYPIVTTGVEYC